MLERFRKSLTEAPVVNFGDYEYFIHPVADGFPAIDPQMLDDIVTAIVEISDLDCDRIVTVEAMGIPVATALSMRTGIPLTIIRKREYGLDDEVGVFQETGYSSSTLHINGLVKGSTVLLVDDILSTGGTLRAVLGALREMGVTISDVVIVIDKGKARPSIEKDFGLKVKCLARVSIENGRVVLGD